VERDDCAPSGVPFVLTGRARPIAQNRRRCIHRRAWTDHRARCHPWIPGRAGGNAWSVFEAGETAIFDSPATPRKSFSGLSVAGAPGCLPAVYPSYVRWATQFVRIRPVGTRI